VEGQYVAESARTSLHEKDFADNVSEVRDVFARLFQKLRVRSHALRDKWDMEVPRAAEHQRPKEDAAAVPQSQERASGNNRAVSAAKAPRKKFQISEMSPFKTLRKK
jgi:hypothetical protein